jgi:hypothetical protein
MQKWKIEIKKEALIQIWAQEKKLRVQNWALIHIQVWVMNIQKWIQTHDNKLGRKTTAEIENKSARLLGGYPKNSDDSPNTRESS